MKTIFYFQILEHPYISIITEHQTLSLSDIQLHYELSEEVNCYYTFTVIDLFYESLQGQRTDLELDSLNNQYNVLRFIHMAEFDKCTNINRECVYSCRLNIIV